MSEGDAYVGKSLDDLVLEGKYLTGGQQPGKATALAKIRQVFEEPEPKPLTLIAIDGRGFCYCALIKPVVQHVRAALGLPYLPVLPIRIASNYEVDKVIKSGASIPHIGHVR